jgi:MFS transporter, MHS family, proline/betaine transporter
MPAYAFATSGSVFTLLLADVSVGVALGALAVTAHIAERFPAHIRASGIGLTLGLATALVGGTAPLVGSALAQAGLRLAIPIYIVGLSAAGLVATLRAPSALPVEVLRREGASGPG